MLQNVENKIWMLQNMEYLIVKQSKLAKHKIIKKYIHKIKFDDF